METRPGTEDRPEPETALRTSDWIGFVGSWFLLIMGLAGLFRGTLGALGAGDLCIDRMTESSAAPCSPVSHESVPVGIALAAGGALLGAFVARGFGVPAAVWAAPLFLGGEGAALLIAAFRSAGGLSTPLLLGALLCAALAAFSCTRLRAGRDRFFLGRRRLDGGDRGAGGLPGRDAAAIVLAWVLAIGAGALFAAALR